MKPGGIEGYIITLSCRSTSPDWHLFSQFGYFVFNSTVRMSKKSKRKKHLSSSISQKVELLQKLHYGMSVWPLIEE